MQNLVPVLALKPDRVYHLATSKTAARSANIIEAARQAQVITELDNICLTEMPSITETSLAVIRSIAEAKDQRCTPVVNFTGGTKLMSIGAYEAAMREEAVSLYVDTDHQRFLDGHTGPKLNTVLGDDFSFTPLQKVLTVNAIAVANGRQRVTGGQNWRPFLPLAQYFLKSPNDEAATWQAIHGIDGLCPNGREPRFALDWLSLLDKPIALPPEVGDLAIQAGLVRANGAFLHLPDSTRSELEALSKCDRPAPQDYFAAVRPVQFTLALLSGGWWEVAVVDTALRSGQFRDLRWSVNVGESKGGFDPEEDIVGVDGVQIVYFSCKRGGSKARLFAQLDELDNRARCIGGRFARRFLAVYLTPCGQHGANLLKRARELNGIQIITARDLENLEVFARRPRL
ncbi:MAG: hypothetical protein M1608_12320 [Candidatus Omnitrophica bacterium]|nr:hypothetical protein [Candidatus Omnitrophota bacterium]